jgi:hypothetical protein
MSFSNWLNRFTTRKTSKSDRSRKAKPRRFRPLLETLEDRCVPAPLVKNLLDNGDPNDLRSQIMAAAPGDTVKFQKGLSGTITLQMGELDITKDINIDATGANIVIDAHYASSIFAILGAASLGINVGLTNLTIEHGLSGSHSTGAGGGMVLYFANVTMNQCNVIHNEALGYAQFGSAGGGIWMDASQLLANQCNITDNIAVGGSGGSKGGGIYAGDFTSSVQMKGGTLLRNIASGGNDGGSDPNYTAGAAGADAYGGGLCAERALVKLQGVEIDNNAAYGGDAVRSVRTNGLPGGNAYGGALYISNNWRAATIFACPSHQNKAEGGIGGNGGDGTYGGYEGGAGGNGEGGWLFADHTSIGMDSAVDGPPYVIQGNESLGGRGGLGGDGSVEAGRGGDGGSGRGGAIYARDGEIHLPQKFALPLNFNQPWGLIENTAQGGDGGWGGIVGNAGNGGTGGNAEGGGLELVSDTLAGVTGFVGRNTVQGGQGGRGSDGKNIAGNGGNGGDALGGALNAQGDFQPLISTGPFGILSNSATGGQGGNGGNAPNGGNGGNGGAGFGGAFNAEQKANLWIQDDFLRYNSAKGGAGGSGGGITIDTGQGGMGGAGGRGQGGAVNLDNAKATVFDHSTLSSNNCTGGQGGHGGPAWGGSSGSGGNGGVGGASQGAALAIEAGSADLTNDVFYDNHGWGGNGGDGADGWGLSSVDPGGNGGNGALGGRAWGGSIFVTGASTVNMLNSTITRNSVQGGYGGLGGSAFEFYFVSPGRAGYGQSGGDGAGGGLFANGGTIMLLNNTFDNNFAGGGGGGTGGHIPDTTGPDGGNGGDGGEGRGGGLAAEGAKIGLINNTFAKNSARGGNGGAGGSSGSFDIGGTGGNGVSGLGGAVYASDGALQLINVTIDGNKAVSGNAGPGGFPVGIDGAKLPSYAGGVFADIGVGLPDIRMMNTIVAQDQADIDPDIAGLIHSSDHDFIGDGTGAFLITSSDDQIGGIDPKLSGLGNYGGPTDTMIPNAGSPVNDTGDNNALSIIAAAEGVPQLQATDQRGQPRLDAKLHDTIDIGATEYGVGPTTPLPGDPSNGAPFPSPKGNGAIVPPGIPHGGLHLPSEAFEAFGFVPFFASDEAEALMTKVLGSDSEPHVRAKTVRAFASRSMTQQALQAGAEALRSDESQSARLAALNLIWQCRRKFPLVDSLVENTAKNDPADDLRKRAGELLGNELPE